MDYGKLAYLKAEELEGRLSASPRRLPSSAVFTPGIYMRAGYDVAEIRAADPAAVILKLTLTAVGAVDGRISAALGGLTFADSELHFSGTHTEVLIGSAEPTGTAMLTLTPEGLDSAVLERVEIVLVGGDGIGREAADFAVAQSETGILAVFGRSMSVIGRLLTDDLGAETVLGRGSTLDACGLDDGYLLAYNDALGNLWLKKLDADLQQTAVLHAGSSVASPAVFAHGGVVYLAYAENGEAYVRTVDEQLTFVGAPVPAGFSADAVSFVRGAPRPVLVIESKGKCYIKISETGETVTGTVAFTSGFAMEAVDVEAS